MSYSNLSSYPYPLAEIQPAQTAVSDHNTLSRQNNADLAAAMTREASSQTYSTIRFLADRPLRADAYRAYAYFRWVDDIVDQDQLTQDERIRFLERQQRIVARCYRGERINDLGPEERLVADLIAGDPDENSGLQLYISHMMAVMFFDARRKGRLISEAELAEYTRCLATSVSEALYYFIGHDDPSPQDESRYTAVTGAHITHMLRDALEDTAVGYYNIPLEYLEAHGISPTAVDHEAYRAWVQNRVQLARDCFAAGKVTISRLKNLRCRLAGFAYIARFEVVLEAIEKDGYRLRAAYPERKSKKAMLKMGLSVWQQTAVSFLPHRQPLMPGSLPAVEVS